MAGGEGRSGAHCALGGRSSSTWLAKPGQRRHNGSTGPPPRCSSATALLGQGWSILTTYPQLTPLPPFPSPLLDRQLARDRQRYNAGPVDVLGDFTIRRYVFSKRLRARASRLRVHRNVSPSPRRPYFGGCSSLFNQPVTLSVFSGSGPSQSKHWNVRCPLPPGGSARIKKPPQRGQVGRSACPMR